MTTQTIVDGVTLSAASWANDVDNAAYAHFTSPAGTNTLTATGPANFTYVTGAFGRLIPVATNTSTVTLNVTPTGGAALGAKNVFYNGAACVAGELQAAVPVAVVYDGTRFNLLGSGLVAATQAQMEQATSTNVFVSPGRQHNHPSAAKFWVQADSAGTLTSSYNMTSLTDTGTGVIGGTINVDFSSANWCGVLGTLQNAGAFRFAELTAIAAGTFAANCYDNANVSQDPTYWFFAGFGDQ
jgi:hypothetical protein